MWPKLLVQYLPYLVDLLPHVRRVIPIADKLLTSSVANQKALADMSDDVKGSLGEVARAHIDLATRLDSFVAYVGEISLATKETAQETARIANQTAKATSAIASAEARLTTLEQTLRTLILALGLLLLVALILLIVLLYRAAH